MTNKLIIVYLLVTSLLFGQTYISYDSSDQFGVVLDNNQIIWDSDKKFDDLLIDRSSTYFNNKFSSFDFNDMPSDSLYVKSKFQYEFGDYGFDKLNIGLKKHSEESDFEFIAMKKSFFGTYSEFANQDSSPLSLFYKVDYTTSIPNGSLYFSTGYFREDSKFLFDTLLETHQNKEFSYFLSFTAGSIIDIDSWKYNFELNHIDKYTNRVIIEDNISHEVDIERNRFNMSANNGRYMSITSFIDNTYYFDHNTNKGYSKNILQLSNSNEVPFGNIAYGIDYIADKVAANIGYEATLGVIGLSISRKNKPNMILFDGNQTIGGYLYDPKNSEEIQNWDSLILSYKLDKKITLHSALKFTQANNLQGEDLLSSQIIADLSPYFSFSDDMLSLQTSIQIPIKDSKIDIIHYHNFYDSLISSNRSDILDFNYHFKTSFINQKLGIDGKLSLRYLSRNDSQYSFNYFRNMPVSNIGVSYDESYNIGLDLNISIADVLLTVRLKNALHRLPIDGDYSINNTELFNPMNSLLSFGIIWEFDD